MSVETNGESRVARETSAVGRRGGAGDGSNGGADGGADAGPLRRKNRVIALDAARGFALLGIFAVNVQLFGNPFGEFMTNVPGASESGLSKGLYYVVKICCEGKFYPLFSMLFGMGLVLQMSRAAPGAFVPLYLRRLGVLLVIGAIHATLIWFGDILFLYALAGIGLLLSARLSGKTLLGIGTGLVLFVALACGTMCGGLTAVSERAVESGFASVGPGDSDATRGGDDEMADASDGGMDGEAAEAADEEAMDAIGDTGAAEDRGPKGALRAGAFAQLMEGLQNQTIQQGPGDPAWIALERQAFGKGPWLDAFLFNLIGWVMSLGAGLFSYAWHVLGLFFVGAGLMKIGVFDRASMEGAWWRRRLLAVGAGVGVPMAALGAVLPTIASPMVGYIGGSMLLFLSGPLVALMYLSAVWRLAEWSGMGAGGSKESESGSGGAGRMAGGREVGGWVIGVLARVGRMALTNYLLHSVIFTGIFRWWGLGLFGELSRPERLALVPLVFGVLCVTSWLWLMRFRMGPMEWVWRSLTYWKVQRLAADPEDRGV